MGKGKLTVKQAIKFLQNLPPEATLRAYEGGMCGIVIEEDVIPPFYPGEQREIAWLNNDGRTEIAR